MWPSWIRLSSVQQHCNFLSPSAWASVVSADFHDLWTWPSWISRRANLLRHNKRHPQRRKGHVVRQIVLPTPKDAMVSKGPITNHAATYAKWCENTSTAQWTKNQSPRGSDSKR